MFGTRPCRHIISFDQQEGSVSSTAALRHQLMENDNSFSDRSWDVYSGDVLIQSDLPEAEKIRFKDPIPQDCSMPPIRDPKTSNEQIQYSIRFLGEYFILDMGEGSSS